MNVLQTERLTLRPPVEADAPALWPFVSDPAFPRFMSWAAHKDLSETKAFIASLAAERTSDAGYAWAMTHGNEVVGLVGLHEVVRTMGAWRVDRGELGYWVGPPHQDRGYVTEAARAVLACGFEALALHKVVVSCVSDNMASRRVIAKLGFRQVGEQREHVFRDGRWWNQLTFELCLDEWRAREG